MCNINFLYITVYIFLNLLKIHLRTLMWTWNNDRNTLWFLSVCECWVWCCCFSEPPPIFSSQYFLVFSSCFPSFSSSSSVSFFLSLTLSFSYSTLPFSSIYLFMIFHFHFSGLYFYKQKSLLTSLYWSNLETSNWERTLAVLLSIPSSTNLPILFLTSPGVW